MDLEEQILHYYLKLFSFFVISATLIVLSYCYFIINKEIKLDNKEKIITIIKGQNIKNLIDNNLGNNNISNKIIFNFFSKLYLSFYNTNIHYGEFYVDKKTNFFGLLQIVTKPSNIINKIIIIEGWSKKQLNLELRKHFNDAKEIDYSEIIADTYYFNKGIKFNEFYSILKQNKLNYINKYKKNTFFDKYNINDLFIIGSLIEKEGFDNLDKKLISSVIFNRLDKKMRLQIDATVIFAITNGEYNLERKLNLKDLKFNHSHNTYLIKALPPSPISYVGKKTIDIIFENYKSDFLFYFFNNTYKRHVFSKTFEEHKYKLNEYRK